MPPLIRPLHYTLRLRQGRPSLLWRSSCFREQSLLEKAGIEGHRGTKPPAVFPKTREGGVLQRRRRSRAEQPELRVLNMSPTPQNCSLIFNTSFSRANKNLQQNYRQTVGIGRRKSDYLLPQWEASRCLQVCEEGHFRVSQTWSGTRYEPNLYHPASLVRQQGQHLHHRVLDVKCVSVGLGLGKVPPNQTILLVSRHIAWELILAAPQDFIRDPGSFIYYSTTQRRSTLTTCSFHLKVACV